METFRQVIEGPVPVLVDFYATWCQPCKMMHPVLEQLKQTVGDRVRIVKLDVERNPQLAQAYGVQAVPTLLLFHEGELVWRQSGAQSKADLMALLDPFLK